jgi:hypothetical protein
MLLSRHTRRRESIALLGGAAGGWPFAARAPHGERIRRVGILQGFAASDPEWQRRFTTFKQGLQELGRTEGRNVTFELRFADNKPGHLPNLATELSQAKVDVIDTNAAQPVEAGERRPAVFPSSWRRSAMRLARPNRRAAKPCL